MRGMRRGRLGLAVPLLAAALARPAISEGPAATDAGASFTAGSGGYRGWALFGDADWRRGRLEPYARAEYDSDSFTRQLQLSGGAWKDFEEGVSAKAGGGLILGRLKDSDQSGSALVGEAAAEKEVGEGLLGAEFRLTAGTIGGTMYARSAGSQIVQRGRGLGPGSTVTFSEPAPYSVSELSGYAAFPAGRTTLSLRLTSSKPSYAGSVRTETLSWKVPLNASFSLKTSLAFDQGSSTGTFVSVGGTYKF